MKIPASTRHMDLSPDSQAVSCSDSLVPIHFEGNVAERRYLKRPSPTVSASEHVAGWCGGSYSMESMRLNSIVLVQNQRRLKQIQLAEVAVVGSTGWEKGSLGSALVSILIRCVQQTHHR